MITYIQYKYLEFIEYMQNITAIYLITTIEEFNNNRLFLFLKNLSNYTISKIKIPLIVFFDKLLDEKYEAKIFLLLKFFGFYEKFSEIEIVNNNIPDNLNIYTYEKLCPIPKYGSTSGPNIHFFSSIKYKTEKYPIILLLETDCVFIKDNCIDIINNSIQQLDFWIYGSKYYGNNKLEQDTKDHINGVGIYNRTIDYLIMIDNVMEYIKNYVINIYHFINYDVAIHKFIDDKKYLLIDSEEILNISTNNDIDICYDDYLLLKPNVLLIHQKIKNNEMNQNDYLLDKILNLNYLKESCNIIRKNTIMNKIIRNVYGFHKSGTTFFDGFNNSLKYYDKYHYLIDLKRDLVSNYNKNIKYAIHIRNPLDLLVSAFYSFGYTHMYSDIYKYEEFLKQKQFIQTIGIDSYCIEYFKYTILPLHLELFKWLEKYYDEPNVYISSYEKMKNNFSEYIKEIGDFFEYDNDTIRQIYEYNKDKNSFVPVDNKDIIEGKIITHYRNGKSKQYLTDLKPETYKQLMKEMNKVIPKFLKKYPEFNL